MSQTVNARKPDVIKEYQKHEKDCGSAEVQVALLTDRIRHLTEHLKSHKKDFASRRGLLMLVGRRTRLVNYIKRKDPEKYKDLIQRLGLRR